MGKKFYEKTWFIVLLSIYTFGLYAIYFFGIKKFGKKFAIYPTITIVVLYLIIVTMIPKGEAEYSYELSQSSLTFELPEIPAQNAVYGEPELINLQKGNYLGGQDLPAGTYNVSISSGSMCQLKIDNNLILNDSTRFGAECSFNNISVKEGSSIEVMGDTLAFSGKGEMISPGTPVTPAKIVEEQLISNEFEDVCYIDSSEVDCVTLTKYDELSSSLEKTGVITEKVVIFGDTETCSIDGLTKPCAELKSYERLSDEIIVK
jgi:hypothetical protein